MRNIWADAFSAQRPSFRATSLRFLKKGKNQGGQGGAPSRANSLDPQFPFLYDQPAPKRVVIDPGTITMPLISDRGKTVFLSSMTG
jgi:hypothetical protein